MVDLQTLGNFSERELDVLACMVNGCSYKKTAILLNISYRTVGTHVRHILSKVECLTREELTHHLKKMEYINKLSDRYAVLAEAKIQQITPEKKSSPYKIKTIVFCWIMLVFVGVVAFSVLQKEDVHINPTDTLVNKHVIERRSIEKEMGTALKTSGGINIVVLVGHGGAGKTTLARKYVGKSDYNLEYEINAETLASIRNSLIDLAYKLVKTQSQREDLKFINSIPDENERYRQLLHFVQARMKETSNWKLILDNLENLDYLKEFCPHNLNVWGRGKVIITTRNENIKTVSYLGEINIIPVRELEKAEKVELFCKILGVQPDKAMKKFLEQIPSYPLDVSSAAYYIKNTEISLAEYSKYTKDVSDEFVEMSKRLMEESTKYSKTRYGIVTSNFREILSKNKQFAELILLICLLDSQEIPLDVLRKMNVAVVTDDLIFRLREYSMITCDNDRLSIHRNTQNIGLDYILKEMNASEKSVFVKKMISLLTPYEYLDANYGALGKFIPHLKSFYDKIDELCVANVDGYKIALLLTIGDIYRLKESSSMEAITYFKKALEINKKHKCLSKEEIALINFKIGWVYSLISQNDEAMKYLASSAEELKKDGNYQEELAQNYRLIGIINMRKNLFNESNASFEEAIDVLNQAEQRNLLPPSKLKMIRARVYCNMSYNYFMDGINRGNAIKAVDIMKKAIDLLIQDTPMNEKIVRQLISCKSRLSGIYNALGKYDLSLQECKEADDLIKTLPSMDNRTFYAKGIIFRERGLSYLRLNKVKEAYDYFMKAKEVFLKAEDFSYLFRLTMHEAETLIRLNRSDEAFRACEEAFAMTSRERNNYCDLFFNTCYYHAALIKYRQGDVNAALKYFGKFYSSMKELCRRIVPNAEYNKLIKQNAFDGSDIEKCFENSLKVFEAIYWKDYEFTKYYIEENLKNYVHQRDMNPLSEFNTRCAI